MNEFNAGKMLGQVANALGCKLTENVVQVAGSVKRERDLLKGTLKIVREDFEVACGEMVIPLPEPGSDVAKVVAANRILSARNRKLANVRDRIVEMVEHDGGLKKAVRDEALLALLESALDETKDGES